jgi:gliding motility-associated-like protein
VTEQAQPNAGGDGVLLLCEGTVPTDIELFSALGGTPESGGIWTNVGLTYTYTVSAIAPCSLEDAALVAVSEQSCEMIIPSGFTPSGDGMNEIWDIVGLDELHPKNKVFIYNRWGNLIYESVQGDYSSNPWDGKYNGKDLPSSSFYYIIYTDPDGDGEVMKGTLTLIKK